MKTRLLVCSVLAIGLVCLVAGSSYSGPEEGDKATDGENKAPHGIMGVLQGRWKVESRVWTDKDEPTVTEAKALNMWFMDGKFLRLRYTGTLNGERYHAAGFMGYCLEAREFQLVWLSTASCSMYPMTGQCNEAGTELTFKFTHKSKKGELPCRLVYTITDPNNYMVESWVTTGGQESQSEQLIFTRIGATEAKDPEAKPKPEK